MSRLGNTLEDRQRLLDHRTAKRAHKKRHGKNKRRSCQQRESMRKAKARAAEKLREWHRKKSIAIAYWRGERDDLSGSQ